MAGLKLVREKSTCICCDSSNLKTILDFGKQPLANSYHDGVELEEYPLALNLCMNCYHLQLSHIVHPDELFKDYMYLSGTSVTLKKYFDWFVEYTVEEFLTRNSRPPKKILEVACNDGTQLESYIEAGYTDVYGVDPAENIYETTTKDKFGDRIACAYFSSDIFDGQTYDMIVAQNVFAHNEDAYKFLMDADRLMHDDSLLFIQTSQADMVKSNQFDTIYHEHLSFFNINSMWTLVNRTNLRLMDVIKTPIHGTSYIFVLSKSETITDVVIKPWKQEKRVGLYDLDIYLKYAKNAQSIRNDYIQAIRRYRAAGFKIVGYGAAAKGMTFLNYAKEYPDIIIDDSPVKWGKKTPGSNLDIVSIDYLKEIDPDDKVLFVVLAWNFYDEIRFRIKSVRDNVGDLFLQYFPKVKVVK